MPNTRRTWPYANTDPYLNRDTARAYFATPDCFLRSDRQLSGSHRTGTEPRVGPRENGPNAADYGRQSDFGMDRVSPRDFDPAGTPRNRFGEIPSSLITEKTQRRNDD